MSSEATRKPFLPLLLMAALVVSVWWSFYSDGQVVGETQALFPVATVGSWQLKLPLASVTIMLYTYVAGRRGSHTYFMLMLVLIMPILCLHYARIYACLISAALVAPTWCVCVCIHFWQMFEWSTPEKTLQVSCFPV